MSSMREAMPTVTAWIDAMRGAFGADAVTGWIREGLDAGAFYATENGHQVGVPIVAPAHAVSLADMVLVVPEEPKARRR